MERVQSERHQLRKTNERLAEQLESQKVALEKAAEEFQDLESKQYAWKKHVYGRFKDLLNSKKRKIRKLNQIIEKGMPSQTSDDKKPKISLTPSPTQTAGRAGPSSISQSQQITIPK